MISTTTEDFGPAVEQMRNAPIGAIYVWRDDRVFLAQGLARRAGRPELRVEPLSWLKVENVEDVGCEVVVDFGAKLGAEHIEALAWLSARRSGKVANDVPAESKGVEMGSDCGRHCYEVKVADASVGSLRIWASHLEQGERGGLVARGRVADNEPLVTLWCWAPGAWLSYALLDSESGRPVCMA